MTTWQRQQVFVNAVQVQRYNEMLIDAAHNTGFRLLAYCFMPDHLHLLVEGSEGTDLAQLMKAFKQVSSHDYKRRVGQPLWQRSYYDHVLRRPDELQTAVEYILDNPARAGLADDPCEYPFSGGEVREMLVAT